MLFWRSLGIVEFFQLHESEAMLRVDLTLVAEDSARFAV